MGLIEFSKLPVNTLVGADWKTFKAITKDGNVSPEKLTKYRLSKAVCWILSNVSGIQAWKYKRQLADKPMEHDPLFILGHWRSGTTFVHNIFAQDKHFGYTTTYQTVFPHYMMFGQGMFKPTMGWLMPDHRPTDNMELAPDLPQEEEFALANTMPYTYYNFWYYPDKMLEYCDRYLTFEKITPEELQLFNEKFVELVKISLWNTGGTQYLSKNPPHTGRVEALSKLFPDAKFIYLMRNPYTVFESTRNFFSNTIKPLELNIISEEELERNILETYMRLFHAYEKQKAAVGPGHLFEVKFEEFEKDAMAITRRIYEELNLPGWNEAEADIKKYVDSKKSYKKNDYVYTTRTIQLVNEHWGEVLDKWGYDRL